MPHYLRIAVTALSLTACVLLIVLWVRSYWRWDRVGYRSGGATGAVVSENGVLFVGELYLRETGGWKIGSGPVTNPVAFRQQFAVAYFDDRPSHVCIAFPHWLLLLPLSGFAAAPWLSWRFRTRTLLMIATAWATLLGIIAWASR